MKDKEWTKIEKSAEILRILNDADITVFDFYNTVLDILIEMHPEVKNHPKFKELGERYKKVRDRILELQREIGVEK
jgi:phage terminase small subunit